MVLSSKLNPNKYLKLLRRLITLLVCLFLVYLLSHVSTNGFKTSESIVNKSNEAVTYDDNSGLIGEILNGLKEMFQLFFSTFAYNVIWIIIQGLLMIIQGLDFLVRFLSNEFIIKVVFNVEILKTEGIGAIFKAIPKAMLIFMIISVVLVFVLFGFNYIYYAFVDSVEPKERLLKAIKFAVGAIVLVFFLPWIIFTSINLIQLLFGFIIESVGGEGNFGLADTLYFIGDEKYGLPGHWADGKHYIPHDHKFESPSIASGDPLYLQNYNIILEVIAVVFVGAATLLLCIDLVKKALIILTLIISAPIIASTMVIDDGQRMKQWKDQVLNKSIVAYSTLFSYSVFMVMFISLNNQTGGALSNPATKMLFQLVLLIGGAMFLLEAGTVFASMVGGESAGAAEGLSAGRSMMGLAMGGAVVGKIMKSGIGLGKKKMVDPNGNPMGGAASGAMKTAAGGFGGGVGSTGGETGSSGMSVGGGAVAGLMGAQVVREATGLVGGTMKFFRQKKLVKTYRAAGASKKVAKMAAKRDTAGTMYYGNQQSKIDTLNHHKNILDSGMNTAKNSSLFKDNAKVGGIKQNLDIVNQKIQEKQAKNKAKLDAKNNKFLQKTKGKQK